MQLDKQQVLEFLQQQGQQDKAQQADQELPAQVDTDRDAGLLQKYGIDVQALAKKFLGGSGIPGL